MPHPGRRIAVPALALAGAVAMVLVSAGVASAHVTVNSSEATQGGYAKLTFRVPNETDDTNTTKVQVFFPKSQPLASVSIQPLPGWSYRVKTEKLTTPITSDDGAVTRAVAEIIWTADSAADAIKPGEFDEFNVSAGPLPKAPTMEFKALQTYSNGDIVRWIDPSTPGQAEPEHPAPVLTLPVAGGDASTSDTTPTVSASSDDGRANTALVLSILALVVAVGAGAASFLRRSRS
jgi:uncharacterized protein YcnI